MINYGHLLPLRLTCQFSNPCSKHKAKILNLLMNGWQWMSFYCIPDAQGRVKFVCSDWWFAGLFLLGLSQM